MHKDEQKETERAQLLRRQGEIQSERSRLACEEFANDMRLRELDGQARAKPYAADAQIVFANRHGPLAEELRFNFEASADDEPVRGEA